MDDIVLMFTNVETCGRAEIEGHRNANFLNILQTINAYWD